MLEEPIDCLGGLFGGAAMTRRKRLRLRIMLRQNQKPECRDMIRTYVEANWSTVGTDDESHTKVPLPRESWPSFRLGLHIWDSWRGVLEIMFWMETNSRKNQGATRGLLI